MRISKNRARLISNGVWLDVLYFRNMMFLFFMGISYAMDIVQRMSIAVESDGLAVRFVDKKNMAPEAYVGICEKAVQNSGHALYYVDNKDMAPEAYIGICEKAVQNDGYALGHVDNKNMAPEVYIGFCEKAVQNNGYALLDVDNNDMEPEAYVGICEKAVQEEWQILKYGYVDEKYMLTTIILVLCKYSGSKRGVFLDNTKPLISNAGGVLRLLKSDVGLSEPFKKMLIIVLTSFKELPSEENLCAIRKVYLQKSVNVKKFPLEDYIACWKTNHSLALPSSDSLEFALSVLLTPKVPVTVWMKKVIGLFLPYM